MTSPSNEGTNLLTCGSYFPPPQVLTTMALGVREGGRGEWTGREEGERAVFHVGVPKSVVCSNRLGMKGKWNGPVAAIAVQHRGIGSTNRRTLHPGSYIDTVVISHTFALNCNLVGVHY